MLIWARERRSHSELMYIELLWHIWSSEPPLVGRGASTWVGEGIAGGAASPEHNCVDREGLCSPGDGGGVVSPSMSYDTMLLVTGGDGGWGGVASWTGMSSCSGDGGTTWKEGGGVTLRKSPSLNYRREHSIQVAPPSCTTVTGSPEVGSSK